jgi:type II secretory pathway component PulF
MPRYIYTARPSPQKIIQGNIEAESPQDALNRLAKSGYFPLSLEEQTPYLYKQAPWQFGKRVTRQDIAIFTGQLSALLESGVNILNGLNIISNQTANRYLKAVINDMIAKVKDGHALSESLSYYQYLFSNLYISTVRIGETSGTIESSLKRLSSFLDKEEDFKNAVLQALTYPLIVFTVGVLTVIILIGFVVPKLMTIFEEMGQLLPLPTRILIFSSGLLREGWWLILLLISFSLFLFLRWKKTAKGSLLWDSLKLKTLFLGEIILKTELSRLTHTLALLLSSGITIVYALDITRQALDNQVIKLHLETFKTRISNGARLSQCLKETSLFPDFVTNILTVGEETGTLEKALVRVRDEYEKDVQRKLMTLSRLLEPLIILLMGLVVGFIVLSMLLPVFQINLMAK